MELPVFKLQLDDDFNSDGEINFISIVDSPAYERDFIAFEADKQAVHFKIQSEDKRIISGPAILAGKRVYRSTRTAPVECYYVIDKDTVLKTAQRFFKKGYQSNVNLLHDSAPGDVTIFESFITDSARGIHPMKGFEDAPEGSWFVSMKVDNDEVWNRIKSGELNGFSIEGFLKPVKMQSDDEKILEQIRAIVAQA